MTAVQDTLSLRLASSRMLTPEIRELRLASASGEALPGYEPGAHISLKVTLPSGEIAWREYSLIDLTPGTTASEYLIAVRREDTGRGGSRFVHETLQDGQTVEAQAPRNQFPLDASAARVVLLAGGIGVTPLASMAAFCRHSQRPLRMHYAGRSRTGMALLAELEALLGDDLCVHADDEQGRPFDVAALFQGELGANDHLYFCGPLPLIDAVIAQAEQHHWPRSQLHFELFNAPESEEGDQAFEVELASTGQVLQVPADKTVLDVLIEAGLDPLYDCNRGECGVCATGVLSGDIDHRDYILTEREKQAGNIMHPCVSRCSGQRLILDL